VDFEEFVAQSRIRLLRFAGAVSGDARLADDVVSEALGHAFELWDRVGAVANPHAYVRKMVLNEYLAWWRRARRVAVRPDMSELVAPVEDHAEAQADRDQLMVELRRLPDKQRAAAPNLAPEPGFGRRVAPLRGQLSRGETSRSGAPESAGFIGNRPVNARRIPAR
jgi:predicted RNA polymerase sigma factor